MKDIDALKNIWQSSVIRKTDRDRLESYTQIRNHSRVARTKKKLFIETFLLIFFIAFYYGALDGAKKSLVSNIGLVASGLFFILVRLYGLYIIINPISQERPILGSLQVFYMKLKRIAMGSTITAFLFGLSLINFFTAGISFANLESVHVIMMVVSLLGFCYLSARIWFARLHHLRHSIESMNHTE